MSEELSKYALRLLAQRAYTVRDLRRKLLQKKYLLSDTDAALERFLESGLLDDRKFAFSFAHARLTSSSASPRRVRHFLMKRGIAADLAEEAVKNVLAEEEIDPMVALERLLRKKLATLRDVDPDRMRKRLFGFLCRRGYDVEDVKTAMLRCLKSN